MCSTVQLVKMSNNKVIICGVTFYPKQQQGNTSIGSSLKLFFFFPSIMYWRNKSWKENFLPITKFSSIFLNTWNWLEKEIYTVYIPEPDISDDERSNTTPRSDHTPTYCASNYCTQNTNLLLKCITVWMFVLLPCYKGPHPRTLSLYTHGSGVWLLQLPECHKLNHCKYWLNLHGVHRFCTYLYGTTTQVIIFSI